MSFNPRLKIGQIISNENMREIFKCGNMGGMRKSNVTKTLVIVSDHTKGIYKDRWEGDILYYTGMGKNGEQDINFSQNKTLNQSNYNGISVFLFEVIKAKEYVFMGQVVLCNTPYKEVQHGEDGNERLVWIFPVALKNKEETSLISENMISLTDIQRQKKVKHLSILEVKQKAMQTGNKNVSYRNTKNRVYDRNFYVSEYSKRRAAGFCELCKQAAPFINDDGQPYLETHHIIWLSNGGHDTIDNTVALCPNCHRKMHILRNEEDMYKLKKLDK